MTPIRFTKMQGLGNDFIVIDNTQNTLILNAEQIRFLADRHFGVGCDQLLMVESNTTADADFNYTIYNADGSQVEQCGNGARCFARFVYTKGLSTKTTITAKTLSGIITLKLHSDTTVSVAMGSANFNPAAIIYNATMQEHYNIAGQTMGLVNMGNPHAVIIVDDITTTDIIALGQKVQQDEAFINGINVNFVQIIDAQSVLLRTYERGAGLTLACGSGACATVAYLHHLGKTTAEVVVQMTGGNATITTGDEVVLTGPAEFVFEGEIALI